MKKKFLCILLCLAMLCTPIMLSGCSDSEGSKGDPSETTGEEGGANVRSSMTLTLWVPTKDGTTEEAINQTEEALNQITQSEYDTAIKLYAIPDSEYDQAVKDRILLIEQREEEEKQKEIEKRKAQYDAEAGDYIEETTAFENPNMDGDYSLVVRNAAGYANVGRNQMDIFLIRGEEDYKYYTDNYYVESLGEQLSGDCKVLKSYIFPTFIDAAYSDGDIYGIPNNHAVGDYTYMLVNKSLVEAEYLDPERLTSLAECEQFIEDVAKYHKDYAPIYGDYFPSYYRFWSGKDQQTFSVLTSRVLSSTELESVTFDNIFSISNFTTNYYLFKKFTESGYVSKDINKKFAIGYITGGYDDVRQYEDEYYINVFKNPVGERSDYLSSVFAVSCYTRDTARSMEIITLLNTNTKFRTILQYGAEGVHWKYDEEDPDIIVKLSDDYKMNIEDTGNIYMTYPDYGVKMEEWDHAKQQNLASFYPVTSNFEYMEMIRETNPELLDNFDKYCAEVWSRIEGMSAQKFKDSIGTLTAEVNKNPYYQKLIYVPSDNDAAKGMTEENGWFADASIVGLWNDYVAEITGANEQ